MDAGRDEEVEGLLEVYARQVSDLLGEVVRLTAATGGELGPAGELRPPPFADTVIAFDRRDFAREANRLEGMVQGLQQRLQAGTGPVAGAPPRPEFTANRRLGYRRLVEQVREAVARTVPVGASVLVVSRGDRELVDLEGRDGRHFPQDPAGGYLGHHPRDSADAIAQARSPACRRRRVSGPALDRLLVARPLRRLRRAPAPALSGDRAGGLLDLRARRGGG